jgi:two-component system chemotaxis response regulator CheY
MPRVLSVGQCGFDQVALSHHFRKFFDAEVIAAATFSVALSALTAGGFDLVLVNRVTDRDGSLGLDFIRALKAAGSYASVPVMLVSNYRDAQDQAEALGASPGFGKAELKTPETRARLNTVFDMCKAAKAER